MKKTSKNVPDFFIVGAAKSGTTSLAKYLGEHPNIVAPEIKEPKYFVKDTLIKVNDEDPMKKHIIKTSVLEEEAYFDMYRREKDDNRLRFDASVFYLFHHNEVIPKIKEQVGDKPIIIMLRNPIKRAISGISYLKEWHNSSIGEELNQEDFRIKKGYNSFWFYKELGLYSHQIKAYLDNFSKVKVILFEDFEKNPRLVYNEVLEFLSLESFELEKFKKHNVSVEAKKSLKLLRKSGVIPLLKRFIPINNWRKIRLKLHSLFYKKASKIFKKEYETELINYYFKDIIEVEKLLGRKILEWKK